MKWMRVLNYEEMSRMAAERVFALIVDGVRSKRQINIGLATGNTMIKVYEYLAEMLNGSGVSISGLSTFNLDEYVNGCVCNVSPEHSLSYRKYMMEKFFDRLDASLGFDRNRIFFPDATCPEEYDSQITAAGGLDFQLLGIGFNGHIAFNEPISLGDITVDEFARLPSRIVNLNELTIQTNARLTADSNLNIVPRKAVTMGMAAILRAKEILILACFSEQTAPLRAVQTGIVSPEIPASYLLRHDNSTIIYTADMIKL